MGVGIVLLDAAVLQKVRDATGYVILRRYFISRAVDIWVQVITLRFSATTKTAMTTVV